MTRPPHLPPQTCSVPGHYLRQTIFWLFFIVVLTFLSGIAGSLLTVAWVIPESTSLYASQIFFGARRMPEDAVVSPTLVTEVRDRVVFIYDKTKQVAPQVYSLNARIGQVMMLSSDGWGVGFLPTSGNSGYSSWEAIDATGALYSIEQLVVDPVTKLTYLKLEGNGFRVAAFGEAGEEAAWYWSMFGRTWDMVEYAPVFSQRAESVSATEVVWPEVENEEALPGTFLVNDAGALLGIVQTDNTLIPSWLIRETLPSILRTGQATYRGMPWVGRVVDGVEINGQFERLFGWYVEQGTATTSLDAVKTGDIIIAVDGTLFDPARFSRDILEAPDIFLVTVVRLGQEQIITVKK